MRTSHVPTQSQPVWELPTIPPAYRRGNGKSDRTEDETNTVTPISPCTCGHVLRIHGRSWIPDDHCRAWNPIDGACDCTDFDEEARR